MDDTVPKPPVKRGKSTARRTPAAPDGGPAAMLPPQATLDPVPVALLEPPAPEPAPAPHPESDALIPVAAPAAPIPAAPLAEAPAPLTAAKDIIMETIETATTKTQALFGDVTERAKGAVEKSQKLIEEAGEFGKGNVEALVESSKIAARGIEAMGQDAAAYAKKSFEEATAAARTLSSVKSPTEFMKLQSDYARSAFDGLVQLASHNTEAMLKLAGDVAQPLSNRMALAAEKMKVAA